MKASVGAFMCSNFDNILYRVFFDIYVQYQSTAQVCFLYAYEEDCYK